MKAAYLKICRLLAASGFREHEIADFAQELFRNGPFALVEDVFQVRRSIGRSIDEHASSRVFDIPTSHPPPSPSDLEVKIERLLIQDAGIPKALAIAQLTEELNRRFPDAPIPPESRKGFGAWIRKLAMIIPEKEILHIATNLRNRTVHDSPTDWRLK